jgi:hypothetical protein
MVRSRSTKRSSTASWRRRGASRLNGTAATAKQALKLYPWSAASCGREFHRAPTCASSPVHHRNHDHDCNPPDGSNWELLCVYCHDNEHARQSDHTGVAAIDAEEKARAGTGNPFAGLRSLLGKKD